MRRPKRTSVVPSNVLALVALGIFFAIEVQASASEEETFEYHFKWTFVPAASAKFTVTHDRQEGKDVVILDASARSSRLVDPLWKMRDRMRAMYASDTGKSMNYELSQRENLRQVETRVEFDEGAGVARTSWRKRKGKGEWEEKEYDVPFGDACDPLTAAMLIRKMDFDAEEEHHIQVVSGKSIFKVTLKKVDAEVVKTRAGKFDTVKLELTAEEVYPPPDPGEEKEEKVEAVHLWISKEDNPKLIQMQAKAFVGSVTAQLVK